LIQARSLSASAHHAGCGSGSPWGAPGGTLPGGRLGRERPVSLDAIHVFDAVPPAALPEQLVAEAQRSVSQNHLEDLVYGPVGQAVGLLDEVRPAREIVSGMVREAEEALVGLGNR